jgi:predicted nucleic acid-binding protein
MSGESPREFVDANVLVYAFDASAGDKQAQAATLLARLWDAGTGTLSVQVLQEFFVIVTGKVPRPLSAHDAADRIREFTAWPIFSPGARDVLAAITLKQETKLSFRDAMVVHAAIEFGCETLWSEDLNDGQIIRGVRVRNPFASRGR